MYYGKNKEAGIPDPFANDGVKIKPCTLLLFGRGVIGVEVAVSAFIAKDTKNNNSAFYHYGSWFPVCK